MPKLTDSQQPKIFIKIIEDYLTINNLPSQSINASAIVTILGKTRSGRSTLLNDLFYTKFPISQGIQTLTLGSSFQYSNKYNALVIDVQGFGTNLCPQALHRLLLGILMISDIVIVNSADGHINQQQIRRVGIICGVLNKFVPKRSGKCELIWIVQSFGLKLQDKLGNTITQDQYLSSALQYGTNSSEASIYSRSQIKQYFLRRKCLMIAPKQSPNFSVKQVQKLIEKYIKHNTTSFANNPSLLINYIHNLVVQLNTLKSITNGTLNMLEVYRNTLMDYVQKSVKEQETNDDLIKTLEKDNLNFKSERIKQVWEKYFDIQSKQETLQEIEKCWQNLTKHFKIENQYQKKTESALFWTNQDQSIQFGSSNSLQNTKCHQSIAHKSQNFTEIPMDYQFRSAHSPLSDLTNFSKNNFRKDLQAKYQKLTSQPKQNPTSFKVIPKKINLRQFKDNIPFGRNKQTNEKDIQIWKLQKMHKDQQESYIRRLNLTKQYINRLENQQQILRKQLFFTRKTIQDYENEYKYLKNVEVFQCWKCLERITNGILQHMKVCQGMIKEQLAIKILSSELVKGKLYLNILVKVIPTKQKKWEIKKKFQEVKLLQKQLVQRYRCQGLKNIYKNNLASKIKSVQSFLNDCTLDPIICIDEKFRQFIAGNHTQN